MNFVSGYVSTDVNGDNIIYASGAVTVDNNAFNYLSKIRP